MWTKATLVASLFAVAGCQSSVDVATLDNDAPVNVAEPEFQPTIEMMLGTWLVDLRPTPESDAYIVPMTIRRDDSGELSATYYGGEAATEVRSNDLFNEPYIAFVTSDGSGNYHTSFRLVSENELRGTTHSLGRDFLSVWTAERRDQAE